MLARRFENILGSTNCKNERWSQ